jgi:hypothetical protein
MKIEVVASRWDTEVAKILAMAQRLDRCAPYSQHPTRTDETLANSQCSPSSVERQALQS